MDDKDRAHAYPGIGRLHYFLSQVGMIAAVVFVVNVFGPESPVLRVAALVLMVVSVVVDVLRLRNMGVSQWLVFLRFLPFAKTLMWIALTSAQPGWNETRKLDSSGKSILFVEVLLFLMIIFMAMRAGISPLGMPGTGIWAF
jgi:hypothetical protein